MIAAPPLSFLHSTRSRALRTPTHVVVVVAAIASLSACGKRPAPDGRPRTLARVNGVEITQADLDERTRRAPTGGGHDALGNVLQTVVREELIAQKAAQLGLDQEAGYRASLEALEAQVRAFRRQQLGELYRTWALGRASPTEAEARAWFDRNAELVRTRFHVLQILRRNEPAEIARDREELKAGTPFAEVAARRFPELPPGTRAPWDLGELSWVQIPPAWRGVLDRLEPGQVSDVIQGEGGRAWVIQLVGKRADPSISFETEKDRIVQLLRQENAARVYDGFLAELREKATITYASDAPRPAEQAR